MPSNTVKGGQSPVAHRGTCRIESMITVDERGQMVLPKEVRERAKIAPGEKLALVVWEKEGEVCCMMLLRSQALSGMVRDLMKPMVAEVLGADLAS
ncbi:MAG: HgcAB-associated protein HgcC [Thermodesulfobacteriota bacterium]